MVANPRARDRLFDDRPTTADTLPASDALSRLSKQQTPFRNISDLGITVWRRLSSKDLEAIQKRALAEGLPYQTLIASLLHKYATGRLKEI